MLCCQVIWDWFYCYYNCTYALRQQYLLLSFAHIDILFINLCLIFTGRRIVSGDRICAFARGRLCYEYYNGVITNDIITGDHLLQIQSALAEEEKGDIKAHCADLRLS